MSSSPRHSLTDPVTPPVPEAEAPPVPTRRSRSRLGVQLGARPDPDGSIPRRASVMNIRRKQQQRLPSEFQ
jgi:hypothetical protein